MVDSRQGVNLTVKQAKDIADVIAPLLRQGLSPYQILALHPELGISEKTLYNYIEGDVFHEIAGIKKRADNKHLIGRNLHSTKLKRLPLL